MVLTVVQQINEISEWLGPGSLNFFGRPYAGKDERAKQLASYLDAPVLGGGEILRQSQIPSHIKEMMRRGELIPSDNYKEIVLPFLGQAMLAGKPLLLSSVGRMAGEEEGVLAATEAAGHPILAVPYLQTTDQETIRRHQLASRGRDDDTPEALAIRLDVYKEKTIPVLKAYEDKGLLVVVDAMPEEEIVFSSLIRALHERARAA